MVAPSSGEINTAIPPKKVERLSMNSTAGVYSTLCFVLQSCTRTWCGWTSPVALEHNASGPFSVPNRLRHRDNGGQTVHCHHFSPGTLSLTENVYKLQFELSEWNPSNTLYWCLIKNQALDDDTPEERSEYLLTLTSATPGLEVSPTARQARITMAASDNPYGLFSFSQHQTRAFEEQHAVRCAQVLRWCGGLRRVTNIFTKVWILRTADSSIVSEGSDTCM